MFSSDIPPGFPPIGHLPVHMGMGLPGIHLGGMKGGYMKGFPGKYGPGHGPGYGPGPGYGQGGNVRQPGYRGQEVWT